jgi:hypothetical protein
MVSFVMFKTAFKDALAFVRLVPAMAAVSRRRPAKRGGGIVRLKSVTGGMLAIPNILLERHSA